MTDSLIPRLKALTGPDREIDAEIALANGWTNPLVQGCLSWWNSPGGRHCTEPPRFTADIHAAMTLKVEGWQPHVFHAGPLRSDGTQPWTATLCADGDAFEEVEGVHDSSLPIAILIAIMQAKEAAKPSEDKPK